MSLSWKRKPKPKKAPTNRQQERTNRIAWALYKKQLPNDRQLNKDEIWLEAEKVSKSRWRTALFYCNRPFITLEKRILEPILAWANDLALLDLLGLVGNVGLIIAVGMYIGSEKQRRDTEVLTAWQTLTNAYGQPGNGGRIHALEFLNASPRDAEYDYLEFLNASLRNEKYDKYPGANWRRRAICLWICTWPSESLAGIDLSADDIELPEPTAQKKTSDEKSTNTNSLNSSYA